MLNHTGGVNADGQIVAIAYGQRRPTGVPGIAGVPGGGDPKATHELPAVGFGDVKVTRASSAASCTGPASFATKVVSDGELDLNGLRIVPDPGVQIVIDAHAHSLDTTGEVRVIAESKGFSFTLWHGPTPRQAADRGRRDGPVQLRHEPVRVRSRRLPDRREDRREADRRRRADPVDLKLPAVFGGITGHAELVADRANGLHVGSLAISISNAPIGPLLADFNISYDSQHDVWVGGGKLSFPPQPGGTGVERETCRSPAAISSRA